MVCNKTLIGVILISLGVGLIASVFLKNRLVIIVVGIALIVLGVIKSKRP